MNHDVIIAGGGVAGAAVAAALGEFGYRILVVEPGLDNGKRLAGELLHPPGAADLNELGLLDCLNRAGAVPMHGFAVFAKPAESSGTGAHLLPYSGPDGKPRQGLAIEHATLAETLLRSISRLSHVTVWNGSRVTGIDLSHVGHATVTVTRGLRECRLRTPLVVAADGRNSRLRGMAGIRHKQVQVSRMIGYLLNGTQLPHSGFGHVFVGGPAIALAYTISAGATRVMFDLPLETNQHGSEPKQGCVDALPQPLRNDVVHVMKTDTPLTSSNYSIVPEAVIKGRLVCVGDAGGSCHPLTATGLSACTRDAMRLRQALRQSSCDIPVALRLYASLREGPQRTRLAGAEVLYDVFKAKTPEMRLLRQGLLRYWQENPHGRARTMALLTTQEDRLSMMVREYIQVWRHALPGVIRRRQERDEWSGDTRSQAIMGLSVELVRFLGKTCTRSVSTTMR
jgi:2-polyprenyl-6-methoxyphenol hydroxylase-like FAD-dependent oxidoreductase